ncbi:MAG: hypothetical protein Kow0062_08110 [Acidobacteriota bacterium]
MSPARAWIVRVANAGIVVFGLAVIVVLGTGGTRIELGLTTLSMQGLWRPLEGLALCAALRLLAGRSGTGLEGRVVAFFARQGLVPRHAPAGPGRAMRTGAVLGVGLGLAVGVADATHVAVAAGRPGLSPAELVALGLSGVGLGAACGALAGAAIALALWAIARALSGPPSRYALGRWTVAALLVLAPLVVAFTPDPERPAGAAAVMVATAAAFLVALLVVGLLLPAAVLRALDGSWGLAIGGGGLLALLLGLGAVGWLGTGAAGGAGSDSSYPNVLLVTVSGLRADALGCYGAIGELTPEIDGLALRGARLDDAITPSTGIAPAAASLLTGQYPSGHRLRARDGSLELTGFGLPALLASHGFATTAFVSSRRLDGRATRFAEMFARYDDPTTMQDWVARLALARIARVGRRSGADAIRPGGQTVAAFREWLERTAGAPWFAWIEVAEPLRPHPLDEGDVDLMRTPWAGIAAGTGPPASLPAFAEPDERDASERAWVAGYAEAVRRADAVVGELLAMLAARGELSRTIVVLSAERGAMLGGGRTLSDPVDRLPRAAIHVPLIVAGPSVEPGTEVRGPASLVDVLPTLSGLLRIATTRPMEGEDLSRYLLEGGESVRTPQAGPVFSETPAPDGAPRTWAVRLGPWKLVEYPDGRQELFVVSAAGELPLHELRGRNERLRQELADLLTRQRARARP